ncbi:MAG: hypothetical protein GX580_05555 [Candidatus Hydrogenedens sp.]|nr:hypothetical protein [Candidatus Hydrogenedentota bacterium]NLF57084.1 hypothetical protein [Candidatus Hydrogenedens sp.]
MRHEAVHPCAFEKAAHVEFRALTDDIREIKDRVSRLEESLSRGVALLLANLAGMVAVLAQDWLR